MSAPPAKRVKVEPGAKLALRDKYPHATVITQNGKTIDTLVTIFETRYLLSSKILKFHSPWFEKLYHKADSNVVNDSTNSAEYYFSPEPENNTWRLAISGANEANDPNVPLPHEKATAVRAFENVMIALNHASHSNIRLVNCDDIIAFADLAEKFQVLLPGMTVYVDRALRTQPELCKQLNENPGAMLVAAKKLRFKELYNDCFILALGPHTEPRYSQITDDNLGITACEVYHAMDARANAVFKRMIRSLILRSSPRSKNILTNFMESCVDDLLEEYLLPEVEDEEGELYMPAFVKSYVQNTKNDDAVFADSNSLLVNNLSLIKDAECGVGDFKDHFLCYKVTKFPWAEEEQG